MSYPKSYIRLQTEIDEAMEGGKLTRPVVTEAEAKKLPYLQAVIKEGMQVWPPIAGLMPRVSKTDRVVCGYSIPAGMNVCWEATSMMQNKKCLEPMPSVFARSGGWTLL
jgi:cytochrome P450